MKNPENPSENTKEDPALRAEMKSLKKELEKSGRMSSLLRNIADNSPDMLWAKDLEGKYIFANRVFCRELLNAKDTEEPLGKDDIFFALRERDSHPEDKNYHTFGEICADSDKITIENKAPTEFEEYGNVKGKFLFLDVMKAPLLDPQGKIIGTVGSGRDVTEKKLIEEKVKRSEENYKNIFNVTHDAIFIYDKKTGSIIDVNTAAERMYSYSREELMKMRAGSLGSGNDPYTSKNAHKLIKEAIASGYKKFEWEAKKKNGPTFRVMVELREVVFNGAGTIMSIVRDITENKITEQKLIESETSYRELFDNAIDSIYIQDENGIFLDVNQGAVNLYGYPKDFFVGKTPEVLSAPGRNDMNMVRECLKSALTGTPRQFEFWGRKKSGEIFPKLVKLSRGRFFGRDVIFAFSLDITEQKRAEEEKRIIESQIRHTRKLESLGILAGGIAHDFNNLLTGIIGNAGLARMHTPPSDMSLKNIMNIEKIAARAADLCNQLLAYSGKGKFIVLPVDINTVIFEMTALLETSIPRKTILRHILSKEVCTIEIDVSQFRQVLMNLILNASDSIGTGKGKILLKTGISGIIERKKGIRLFLPENMRRGNYVFLEIQDDGEGMDPDTIDRIFDPFFTTKTDGRGLGLSAVIGIVKGCGGLISIESRIGTGTFFRIYFPASSKDPIPIRQEKPQPEIWRGKGTILFADDENDIRLLGKTILKKYGFRVITADNGASAIKKFNRYSDEIVLAILDLKMPEKDGLEVMNEIFSKKPGIPVILSSGYNKSDAVEDFLRTGSRDFLAKPYPPEKLIETVRRMLENP